MLLGGLIAVTVANGFGQAGGEKAEGKPGASGKESPGSAAPAPGDVGKGKEVYRMNCSICHYTRNTQQKIGPGLKELYKRRKFTDGKKVDDASVRVWIEKGGKDMPGFKELLNKEEIADLIAYLKSL